jgi:hypothetical protein
MADNATNERDRDAAIEVGVDEKRKADALELIADVAHGRVARSELDADNEVAAEARRLCGWNGGC